MNPLHILLKLYPGYGLGDSAQMTAVLRHLKKHRANWIIDYQADRGRHSAAIGLVRNAFSYGDAPPCSNYDREIDIVLYDTLANWRDRPNTRVTQCLHERFGMAWDPECGAYEIKITDHARVAAADFLYSVNRQTPLADRDIARQSPRSVVAIQYQGDSAAERKNLSHSQADAICAHVANRGCVPLLIDWRNTSSLVDETIIKTTGRLATSSAWGADAQMNAAIISQCEAFVGIDSGPGKCASATKTPALICWTRLHPALYHDPCPHTAHLVPSDHRDMDILHGNRNVIEFFEENYAFRMYTDEKDLVWHVREWLDEVVE